MMEQKNRPIPCLEGKVFQNKHIRVSVPGSKSITNRALLLATLAEGTSLLKGTLFSDDSRYFLKCIQDLGFHATSDEEAHLIRVTGLGGALPVKNASIYVGSAGTAARFLTAYLGVSEGIWHLDASEQMRRRPMAPLLNSLKEMGCEVSHSEVPDCFPFTLSSKGFHASRIRVDIEHSSQFLSALLISSCLSLEPVEIEVIGSHGMSYVHMTRQMMAQFGVETIVLESPSGTTFITKPMQQYRALEYQIEPDVSAACYFYAMAALLGISVTVSQVFSSSMQGDIQFLNLLVEMGCSTKETPEGICITGPADGHLKGIQADMSSFSDQAITLAALAPFADTPTTITGIGHIRFQESDRLDAVATELRKMGIHCDTGADWITIHPGTPSPGSVDTYEDHRMAMGFSLIGLRASGISINDPDCCRKTFENYFDVLDACLAELR